jgi:hypothetical protein
MVDYSAMKSYLEKNNLHYFIFSQNFKKPNNMSMAAVFLDIEKVIQHGTLSCYINYLN